MKIIYEKHPVTSERKEFLRQKGYKIVDLSYAPDGYESPEPNPGAKHDGLDRKTRLQAELASRGIDFDGRAGVQALQALIDADELEKVQMALMEKGVEFKDDATIEELRKLLAEAA